MKPVLGGDCDDGEAFEGRACGVMAPISASMPSIVLEMEFDGELEVGELMVDREEAKGSSPSLVC